MTRLQAFIAVVGGGDERDEAVLSTARSLGELLATGGWGVVTGGGSGIMEAASAGARQAGGRVVGILPGRSPEEANRFVEIPIATGLGEARNAVIAATAAAAVAVGGEYGTLSEIGHVLKLGKPVVGLRTPWSGIPGVVVVQSPEEAIARLRELLEPASRGPTRA
jgi:uncharacterized protein (TIGR00725 family)